MVLLIVLAAAFLVALAERGREAPRHPVVDAVRRALDSRLAPVVVGFLFALAVWWTWGPGEPLPDLHDELAYLLQAKLFAQLRWTAPGPPSPEFFAQAHVLNDPLVASKYPPGHSLLLAIGELVGSPSLIVILLGALRAGLAFALARRVTNGAIALGTVVLMMHGQSLYFAASFFSETTTGALLLLAWYALLRWREAGERRGRWMVVLALSLGWCAITRPFSAVLFSLPIAVVVVRDVWRARRWRELGLGLIAGSAVVAILPLWSARTTGDWRVWPVAVYTRDYMPFDRPHFGYDSTPPRKTPPPDLAFVNMSLDSVQRSHTVAELPNIAHDRWMFLADQSWWHPLSEGALALVGLALAPAAVLLAAATTVVVFFGYLAHPTWPNWTIYYMEIAPVLNFLTVCGLALVLRVIAREPERAWDWSGAPRAAFAMCVAILFTIPMLRREVRFDRGQHANNAIYTREFRNVVAALPGPSVLFVRHAKFHEAHRSLVVNDPDFARSNTWLAYDRGDSANAALMKRIPDRTAFLFDEAHRSINLYRPLASR
jgi:hypothetical protein